MESDSGGGNGNGVMDWQLVGCASPSDNSATIDFGDNVRPNGVLRAVPWDAASLESFFQMSGRLCCSVVPLEFTDLLKGDECASSAGVLMWGLLVRISPLLIRLCLSSPDVGFCQLPCLVKNCLLGGASGFPALTSRSLNDFIRATGFGDGRTGPGEAERDGRGALGFVGGGDGVMQFRVIGESDLPLELWSRWDMDFRVGEARLVGMGDVVSAGLMAEHEGERVGILDPETGVKVTGLAVRVSCVGDEVFWRGADTVAPLGEALMTGSLTDWVVQLGLSDLLRDCSLGEGEEIDRSGTDRRERRE